MPSYNPNRIKAANRAERSKGGNYKLGSGATLTKRDKALLTGIEQIFQIFKGDPKPCDCGERLHKFAIERKRYVQCTVCRRVWHDRLVSQDQN